MDARKTQRNALNSIRESIASLEAAFDYLKDQQQQQSRGLTTMREEHEEFAHSISMQVATLRGSMAAGERWKKPTQTFLTAEEIDMAKTFGLSEREYAEQKLLAERLGIDLTSRLKKQQKIGQKPSP